MTCEIQSAGAIELYFYDELPDTERAEVQAHLKRCAECRRALDDLSTIRDALAARPVVDAPSGGDWSRFMARLDTTIQRQSTGMRGESGGAAARVVAFPRGRRLVPYVAAAAVLMLVTVSVLSVLNQGRAALPDAQIVPRSPTPLSGTAESVAAPSYAAPVARNTALVSLTGQHFERSKLVVLGIATRDPSKAGRADWAYERDLATTLLNDTRLYRVAAEERGMNRLAGVMRDLELVFLQTSMSEEPDPASLEQLQRLIRRRDLVTKLSVDYGGAP